MNRRLLPLLALVLAFVWAPAGEAKNRDPVFSHPVDLDNPKAMFWKVAKQLQKVPVVKAKFKQKRKVKALSRPLISKGRMILARKVGLYWATLKPFASTMIITKQGITFRDGSKSRKKSKKNPLLKRIGQLFVSVISGDAGKLKKDFKLYFRGNQSKWTVGLIPTSKLIRKELKQIVMTGSKTVETVAILDRNDDRTTVFLKGIQTAKKLTDEERKLFR